MAKSKGGLVAVARVARPHGIRGEFCVDSHADSPLLFAPGRTLLFALPGGSPKPFAVLRCREDKSPRRLLLALAGVEDRNAAERLRGAEIFVAEADLPAPEQGEEYLHRLMGAEVLLPDGGVLGTLSALLDTPGQLTWVIRAQNGREVLFPAVPQFILGIDARAGRIVIDPPPGLVELYLAPEKGEKPDDGAQDRQADNEEDGAQSNGEGGPAAGPKRATARRRAPRRQR